MAPKSVSISSIGREIRKKQKELRGLKRGRTASQQRRIDLKIKTLDKQYAAVKAMCKAWKLA
jgi:hypothetical protein